MTVEVTKDVFAIGGIRELTAATAAEFRMTVRASINGHHVIEVDLSQTTFMDCSGLGALITLRNLVRDHDGAVRLMRPTALVHRLFEWTHSGDIFEIVRGPRTNQSTDAKAASIAFHAR